VGWARFGGQRVRAMFGMGPGSVAILGFSGREADHAAGGLQVEKGAVAGGGKPPGRTGRGISPSRAVWLQWWG